MYASGLLRYYGFMSENKRTNKAARDAAKRVIDSDPPVGSVIKLKSPKPGYDYDYVFLGRTESGNLLVSPWEALAEIYNPMSFGMPFPPRKP